MQSFEKNVDHIIWWHTFESIFYHGILLIHQTYMFRTITPNMYGIIGSLFSVIYLLVTCINAGLDTTLSPLFTTYRQSRQLFWRLIGIQALINYSIGLVLALIIWGIMRTTYSFLDIPIGIIITIILSESIKKFTKILLQLSFTFRVTVLGELGTVISYVGLVWTGYTYGYSLDPYLIFIPFLFVSLIEMTIFLYYTYHWYQTLPNKPDQIISMDLHKRMIKNRLYTFLNQIHHIIFSSNFLSLLFVSLFGLAFAGIFKFTSTIAHNIAAIFKKIFGTSSSILLARLKNNDLITQTDCFSHITTLMYQLLFALGTFFLLNYQLIVPSENNTQNQLRYLFFLITFLENFFTTYEQFYIIQERTDYMVILNGISVALFYILFTWSPLLSPLSILYIILFIRCFSFLLITTLSFFLWRLKPVQTIRPLYLISSFFISIIFWLAHR